MISYNELEKLYNEFKELERKDNTFIKALEEICPDSNSYTFNIGYSSLVSKLFDYILSGNGLEDTYQYWAFECDEGKAMKGKITIGDSEYPIEDLKDVYNYYKDIIGHEHTLPCQAGDKAYIIRTNFLNDKKEVCEVAVEQIKQTGNSEKGIKWIVKLNGINYNLNTLNKSWFLKEKLAKQYLEEVEK